MFKKSHQFWVRTNKVTFPKKKYLFRKMSLHKLFQSKLLICTQNQKKEKKGVSFIWKLQAKWFHCSFASPLSRNIWTKLYLVSMVCAQQGTTNGLMFVCLYNAAESWRIRGWAKTIRFVFLHNLCWHISKKLPCPTMVLGPTWTNLVQH